MYDLVVLGGGSGGLNVATAAAKVGARVALVEKYRLGGECTHTACVPSKALIQAARIAQQIRGSAAFGVHAGPPEVDFGAVMKRVRAVVADFAGSDSGEGLKAKGIDVYRGSPAFEAYDTVVVDGRDRLEARRFVIATGSRPEIPPIPGLAEAGYLDNTTIWALETRPSTLLILGAGPVGMELGQAFARLGTAVTILSHTDRVLPNEDPEVSERVRDALAAEGIAFHLGVELTGVSLAPDGRKLCKFRRTADGHAFEATRDLILVAAGRLANVEGLGLETVGIAADPRTGIEVDEYLQTRARNIYAIGDVLGHRQFTHAAEREAAVVFQNAILRLPKKMNDATVPWATFLDPEVATVGRLAVDESAGERIFRAEYDDLDRARIDGQTSGFAKVVADASGRIVGATVVGAEASSVLAEFVLAMEHGLTLHDIAGTVHIYPTYSGIARKLANQFAATRLEKGYVRTALRWFHGFEPDGPRADSGRSRDRGREDPDIHQADPGGRAHEGTGP